MPPSATSAPRRPPRTPNRRGEGAQLRDEIVAAATRLLESSGSDDALTLRAVAREAGITAPAIYAHFADRYDILRAVVENTFAELASTLGSAAAAHEAAVPRLRGVARAYLAFATDRPHAYRILFERHRSTSGNLAGDRTPNTDVHAMVGADAYGVLLDAVAASIESGASAANDPVECTNRVWIGLHGQATLQASLPWHPWPRDRDQTAQQLLNLLAELQPA